MSNPSPLIFDWTRRAAESLDNTRVKWQLLSELAQQLLATGQFDAALQTYAAITSATDRRVALLVSHFGNFPAEKIEPLVKLLESDPYTEHLAGRFALDMLERNNLESAWKMVETADEAFETEQKRYDFLEKVLPLLGEDGWERVERFYRTFVPGTYQDWALLAIVKYLAEQERYDEAEKYADFLTLPIRKSWTYWEVSRRVPVERSKDYFDKAAEIVESIEIEPNLDEMMEPLAAQLRIYGRVAYLKGWRVYGERLLERSEAAAAALTMPKQRCRQQCFLGKVLVELKQIDSIQHYLAIDAMLESLPSASDRSQVLVWLAEAGWDEGWGKAVEVLAVPVRGFAESERAEQVAGLLKRFVAHHQGGKSTGDPSEDLFRISGEAFETLYFNPFAEPDCGCY